MRISSENKTRGNDTVGFVYMLFGCYSVLSASTGSLFAATFAGNSPAIRVRSMLIITRITPPCQGSLDIFAISVRCSMIMFIGMFSSKVTIIPIAPAENPTISVSALNTLEISRFEAPIARRIPISFVLSRTEIYVIIPIIIEETTSDIATKAMSI